MEYNLTFEKKISCKVALGKVISDNEWVCILRNTVDTMIQIRDHGTRAFSDYIQNVVINRGVTITTSDELINIVRACYVVNTKDDESKGRKSTFLNNPINKDCNDTCPQEFNSGLLNKEGLTNIITFDVKSFVSDIKNYLTHGI